MSLSNKFDSNIYIEPDGSSWVRIFHHNNPATYGIFVSHTNAEWDAGIYATENKWYDLGILNDITAPYELLVKQKTTPGATETAYRWTQSPNPLTTTDWNQVKPGTVTFNTNSPYSSSSMGGLYTLNGGNHMCLANNTNGNWYGIGCSVLYQGGFPGYPNAAVTTGYLDLYVRVDSLLESTTNLGPAIWLPLNGNLQNQGLSDVGVYNSGATINNEGKIGSCYEFNGSSNFLETSFKIDSTNYSFCCWAYLSPVAGYHLMDCRTADASAGDQPMYVSGSGIQAGNTGTNFYTFPYSFAANTWYHIAIVYSATDVKAYVNGGLIGTTTTCKGYNFNQRFPLRVGTRCSGQNWFKGKVNDVRAYNYSLSAKEVREISKALVLHYKLDNLVGKNLIANSALNGSWAYPSSSYSDKYSPTTLVVPSGSVYTLSFDAKSTVNGDIIRTHYYSPNTTTTCISSQGTTRTASDGYMTFSLSTQWKRYWVIYNQSSTTAVKHIICPRMMSGEGTGTVSVRNVKFEAGAVATPWVPSDYQYDVVAFDSSGYCDGSTNYATKYIMPGQNLPGNTSASGNTQYYGDGGIILNGTGTDTYFSIWYDKPLEQGKIYTLSCNASGLLPGTKYTFPYFAQSYTSMGHYTISHNGRNFMATTMNYTGSIPTTTVNGKTLYRMFMDDATRTLASGQGPITLTDFRLEEGWGSRIATLWQYDTTGTIETTSDSPRYTSAVFINSANPTTSTAPGTVYLEAPCVLLGIDKLTVAFWVKPVAGYGDIQGWLSLTNNNVNPGQDYTTACLNQYDAYIRLNGISNSYYTTSHLGSMVKNTWQQFVITYDGQNTKLYRNGELKNSSSMTAATNLRLVSRLLLGFSCAGGVWRKNQIYYSDFRIYATALSDSDVLELYQTSASIDRDGNYYTRELIEQ